MSLSPTPGSNEQTNTDTVTRRLRAEQIVLLCRHSRPAIISSAVAALYVGWLLLTEHALLNVAMWYAALLLVSVFRLVIQERCVAACAADDTRTLTRHSALLLGGVALHGIIWSLPSTSLLLADPNKQVMMTVFLVGLSAAALGSLAPMRHAYAAFIAPFMLPIAIDYFIVGGDFTNVGFG